MEASTRDMLLDAAERLARARGYNAFSFRDLSERVGVRTASIHYHFPSKGDLGRELTKRYRERFEAALEAINEPTPRPQLARFLALFEASQRQGGVCLCGPLASEYHTLPPEVQSEVQLFYVHAEEWLARVLEKGRRAGEFRFEGPALGVSRSIVAAIEGAMISAGALGDPIRLNQAMKWITTSLSAQP